MLDDCITKKCAHVIIEFLKLHPQTVSEAHFLIDFIGKQGSLDVDWTTLLVPPEGWIVITGDSGSSSPRVHVKGPPLHLILPKRGITGFFLCGKSLTQIGGEERARVIISKVPDIVNKAIRARGGERYKMTRQGSAVQIKPWPMPTSVSPNASPPLS